VAEWLKATVLKTVEVKASVGSNPTLSAFLGADIDIDVSYITDEGASPSSSTILIFTISDI
jgi:hypothetical protein